MSTLEMERFWSKVHKTEACWEWTGHVTDAGYGIFIFNKQKRCAHRVSYQIHISEIPDGLCVLHKCDNRKCVNPEHLFCGTRKENTQDMINKGRMLRGESRPFAKLTEEGVREIRRLAKEGFTWKKIACRFKVSIEVARRAAIGRTWKHVL